MWPFSSPEERRRKSNIAKTKAILPQEIANTSKKWAEYYNFMVWKPNVDLSYKIASFMEPFETGLFQRHPFLSEAPAISVLIVTQGIMASGTHTQQELEEALRSKIMAPRF